LLQLLLVLLIAAIIIIVVKGVQNVIEEGISGSLEFDWVCYGYDL